MKKLLVLFSVILFPYLCSAESYSVTTNEVQSNFDALWVLVAAGLVFLMQAGFKCLEVGLVRKKHIETVAMKNLIDWIVCSLVFFMVGFGFMFGNSSQGIVGTNMFLPESFDIEGGLSLGSIFFIFQLAFVGTAITIVSGAMSERTGFIPYLTASFFIALVIYPVFGHWSWGNLFFENNSAWLADLGFIDFAGSTVVHSVGAWVSLAGLYLLGPRLGRFDRKGNPKPIKAYNLPYGVLGLILLWLGWWGFNGGSTLAWGNDVGSIILNTNLAGAAGGLIGYFHCFIFQKKDGIFEKLIGSVLGGLVAITASPHIQSPFASIIIGGLAGLVHNYGYDFLLKKMKIDDAVGAIPIHGFCGAFGTIALVFFAPEEQLAHSRWVQLGVQCLGVVTCFIWAGGLGYLMFIILKKTVGLRVSPDEERNGISIFPPSVIQTESKDKPDATEEELSEQELRELLQEMG
ncbi:ammonium transporter [Flexithrix dorotheae]|uniref:ammonium transporter n=1 Tax=Flexithrix dorotheae TaxID=70993 RepID=UPI000367B066|nr:ammonium transporter [Flexithrix dorotheae]